MSTDKKILRIYIRGQKQYIYFSEEYVKKENTEKEDVTNWLNNWK